MTVKDINDIIKAVCPNDEDFEKPCISPKYLRQELEQLALDQRQWNEEPTTKNDLGVDCIDRTELLKAMNTWDKFGNDPNIGLIRLITPALQDRYVLYVKYDDMVKCVKGMSSVTPQPRKGHWVLTDVEGNKVWHCHCSECGKDPQNYIGGSEDWWLIRNNLPKFCPNCGSDNREVKE